MSKNRIQPPMNYRHALEKLIQDWMDLAQEAKVRAEQEHPQDLHPHYWAGVQFGLESAAQDLQGLLDVQAELLTIILWRN